MQSSQRPSERTARRKAADEATKKIRLQSQEACNSRGSRGCGRRIKKFPFPSLSEVLEMEKFSLLEIMDSSGEQVEEEVRVNDEWVFTNCFLNIQANCL